MVRVAELSVQPIDPLEAYDRPAVALPDYMPDPTNEELTAYEEIGGRYSIAYFRPAPPTPPESERYRGFADILREDDRKVELARCLGGLGVSVLSPATFGNMRRDSSAQYQLALNLHGQLLASRSKLLRVVGSVDQFGYGDVNDAWAKQYAGQLGELREELLGSELYGPILRARMHASEVAKRNARRASIHHRADGIYVMQQPKSVRSDVA